MGNNTNPRIIFNCEYCGRESSDKPSHYKRKKRHFCGMECYSEYRKNVMGMEEQNSYKGVREKGESKQVYHRRYVERNREKVNILKCRYYHRKKSAEGLHTLDEWNDLKEKHGFKCFGCGCIKKLAKDHIIPLSKGGSNYIENIQPLCRNCNSKKYNKLDYTYTTTQSF